MELLIKKRRVTIYVFSSIVPTIKVWRGITGLSKTPQLFSLSISLISLQFSLNFSFQATKTIMTIKHIYCKKLILVIKFCQMFYNRRCVKNVRIRSFSGEYFPAFGLNKGKYGFRTLFTQWEILQHLSSSQAVFRN